MSQNGRKVSKNKDFCYTPRSATSWTILLTPTLTTITPSSGVVLGSKSGSWRSKSGVWRVEIGVWEAEIGVWEVDPGGPGRSLWDLRPRIWLELGAVDIVRDSVAGSVGGSRYSPPAQQRVCAPGPARARRRRVRARYRACYDHRRTHIWHFWTTPRKS